MTEVIYLIIKQLLTRFLCDSFKDLYFKKENCYYQICYASVHLGQHAYFKYCNKNKNNTSAIDIFEVIVEYF